MHVPITKPYLTGGESEAVAEVISSGWLSQGPRVREFEAAFAARSGAPDAIAVTSCTTALHLALYASGVRPGDEVIVPSLSFIATANSVWQCGATPVFADIDPRTYNLDPAAAEAAITPRTKAIMPVHQVGLPADIEAFTALGARHGIQIVEDAACAVGSSVNGRTIGSHGSPAAFSLHPRKVITTGEGGMITVHDEELAAKMRLLRQHAMDVSDLARHGAKTVIIESYPEQGFNLRMTDMQAAIGLCQMDALDEILAKRARLADRFTAALEDIPYVSAPFTPEGTERTWQAYTVRLDADAPVSRNELLQRLLEDDIHGRRGVMAIHEEPAYAGPTYDLPHTEAATRETLMLPLFPAMTDAEQDYVLERLAVHVAAPAAAAA